MNSLQTSKKINLYLLVIEPVLVESINASTLSVSIELKTLYFPVGFHAWKNERNNFDLRPLLCDEALIPSS